MLQAFAVGHGSHGVCGDAERILDETRPHPRAAFVALLGRCESPIERNITPALWGRSGCCIWVARFTGGDVRQNPDACADELRRLLKR